MYASDNVGRNTIAMVLAGGKGERLSPLTDAGQSPAFLSAGNTRSSTSC